MMADKTIEYYSESLSPIIRGILKQMSEKKISLTDKTLNEALVENEDFNRLFQSTCRPVYKTSITNRMLPYIDSLKGYVSDRELAEVFSMINGEADIEDITDAFLGAMSKQLIKNDKRLSTLTEFVESLFKKVLSTQDKMSDNLEDNIRFVEEDINQDRELMSNAEEIEQILREEGIVFPGKPFTKFMEAFDSKLAGKKDKLESMTESYSKIETELTEYKKEVAQLNENIRKYRQETITDHLTGLNNRKYMDIKLAEEIVRFGRHGQPFCILLMDIDNFKKINDVYGHIVGDQVIKHLGGVVKAHVRKSDFSFRYGGEEFLVLLLNTDIENAVRIAEQIRSKVETTNFTLKDKTFVITVTIGVAQYMEGESVESLLERADKNLYNGKRFGKNRVVG
ncbi:MAG: diguanylate cyclase [Deferribacterales bacterium]